MNVRPPTLFKASGSRLGSDRADFQNVTIKHVVATCFIGFFKGEKKYFFFFKKKIHLFLLRQDSPAPIGLVVGFWPPLGGSKRRFISGMKKPPKTPSFSLLGKKKFTLKKIFFKKIWCKTRVFEVRSRHQIYCNSPEDFFFFTEIIH